jgi:putative phage-type endonuclease
VQLWLEKTGRAPDVLPDEDAAERMHWGTVLEDVVARHFAEQRGVRVQRISALLLHPYVPIAIANIDRAIVKPGSRARWDDDAGRVLGATAVLECKTAHALARNAADWGEPGSADVPAHYYAQCQWYGGIAGLPVVELAVLFGGQKFACYTIQTDQQLVDDMLAEAAAWWQRHVVGDTAPDPQTEDEARRLWAKHVAGRERIVDVTVAEAVEALAEIKAQIKALEDREQQARDRITTAFGDAEAIGYMGRRLATWKANKDGQRTDWRAVAEALAPPSELIAKHTTTTPGARVLRLAINKE